MIIKLWEQLDQNFPQELYPSFKDDFYTTQDIFITDFTFLCNPELQFQSSATPAGVNFNIFPLSH